jgi:hypothetical protein
LWHNLAEHVERAVTRHHGRVKQAMSTASTHPPPTVPPPAPVPASAGEDFEDIEDVEQPSAVQESALVAQIRQRPSALVSAAIA